jgi:lipid-A-disaccharide synthase
VAEQAPIFLVVAGEASGDLHGARVIEALRRRVPGARFAGMGGPRMREAGLEPLYDASEISVMGFVEVLPKLFRILGVLAGLARWAEEHRPVAAILVDIPDFNLRLAKRLRAKGIAVAYYVAPMAWAWRESRVKTLRARVDRLLCIYPFEETWFRDRGVEAVYVGNPLLEDGHLAAPPDAATCRRLLGLDHHRPTVALLPGSRRSEIHRVLPTMLRAARELLAQRPELQLVLPVAATLDRGEIEALCREGGVAPTLVDGRAVEVLGSADAAVVCSGTATLEAALAHRPMVVVFRAGWISWAIAKLFVRLPDVAIVNILAGRRIVPELIQGAFTAAALVKELVPLLAPTPVRERMLEELGKVRRALGGPGASDRVAGAVLEVLAEKGVRLLPPAPERRSLP